MHVINGVPQIADNGIELVNGAKIVIPSLNQRHIINGVPQTAFEGIEIINGVPKSSLGTWPSFGGWTEVDPSSGITLSDASAFDSEMTFGNDFQGQSASVVISLPDTWNNAFGDWNLRFEFAGYDHSANRFVMVGVTDATKQYTGGAGSLATDADNYALWGFRGSGTGWIATQEFINVGVGWDTTGWSGETPAKDSPNVYYQELARESDILYMRSYDDASYTTQLGVDAVSNALGAGFSVDRIIVAGFHLTLTGDQDAWVKFTSITPNPFT